MRKEKKKSILNKKLFYLFFSLFLLDFQLHSYQKEYKEETNPLLNKENFEILNNIKKDQFDYYKKEKYSKPPNINEMKKTKEKDFDFDIGVGVDKNKKELDEIKLDIGKKF